MVEERKGNPARQPASSSSSDYDPNEMAADANDEELVQQIEYCIEANDHIRLEALLEGQKSRIDVTALKFERNMNALTWAARFNADQCFDVIYAHAMKYNFSRDINSTTQLG